MANALWKVPPRSLPHAFQLCVDYAKARHNRSVDQIADLMGLAQPWRLYKWIAEGNMPTHHILSFEHACGARYVTRYLAHAGHQLLIDIPTGRKVAAADINVLQQLTNTAVGAVISFAAGEARPHDVVATLTTAMEGLAWHRANAEKHDQPELDLEEP